MNEWLSILLLFIGLILILIFIGWVDWKSKCRKTIKENKLVCYIKGYAMVQEDSSNPVVVLLSGLLGVNSKELVFGHRFNDSAIYLTEELSDVNSFKLLEYNQRDFAALLHEQYGFKEGKVKYLKINMAGESTTKKLPKLIKTRMLCKIGIKDGSYLFFFYKNSPKKAETIAKIRKYAFLDI